MYRKLVFCLFVILFSAVMALAQDAKDVNKEKQSNAKELSGMSIVGNDEAPHSTSCPNWSPYRFPSFSRERYKETSGLRRYRRWTTRSAGTCCGSNRLFLS